MTSDQVVAVSGGVLDTRVGVLPLTVHFRYSLTDPYAVAMTLIVEHESPCGHLAAQTETWVFARTLLDEAMSTMLPAGDGDVSVEYLTDTDVVRIMLTDVRGEKHPLLVDAEPVVEFLAETFAVCPSEMSAMDVDDVIAQLLAEGSE